MNRRTNQLLTNTVVVVAIGVLMGLIMSGLSGQMREPDIAEALVERLSTHLHESGDWVRVSDIIPGEWTEVCLLESMSINGTQTEASIRNKFGIRGAVILPEGIVSVTDSTWGLMFFTPPNTVRAFSISNRTFFADGPDSDDPDEQNPKCRLSGDAVFVLTQPARGEYPPTIQMTTLSARRASG